MKLMHKRNGKSQIIDLPDIPHSWETYSLLLRLSLLAPNVRFEARGADGKPFIVILGELCLDHRCVLSLNP